MYVRFHVHGTTFASVESLVVIKECDCVIQDSVCMKTLVVFTEQFFLVRSRFSLERSQFFHGQLGATSNFLYKCNNDMPRRCCAHRLPRKLWMKCVVVEIDGLMYMYVVPPTSYCFEAGWCSLADIDVQGVSKSKSI